MSLPLPAWRTAAARPSSSARPSSAPVTKGTRPLWPALAIIVGIPTALFAAEAAFGIITV